MKLQIVKGSMSQIITVFIQDSSSTTGAGLAGLVHTSSIVGGYVRAGGTGVALAVDEDVTTEGTYQAPSAVGKVRIGTPANMTAGTYELHFHNDLFAAGANSIFITLGGAANMAVLPLEIQLTNVDLNDGVRGGMTAMPNAVAGAASGLPLKAAAGDFLNVANLPQVAPDTAGGLPTTTKITDARLGVLTDWINGGRLDLILDIIAADTTTDIPTLIGVAGAGLTAIPWNATWDAEVESEVNDALVVLKLDHLVAVADADDPVNNSIIAKIASATSDWSTFVPLTDSLEGAHNYDVAAYTSVNNGQTQIVGYVDCLPVTLDGSSFTSIPKTGYSLASTGLDLVTTWTVDVTGSLSGSVGSVTTKTGYSLANGSIIAASFATGALSSDALSAAMANKIADHMRRRTQANVEASSDGDALDLLSQYGAIQQMQESSVSGTTMTVKKTDGTTTLGTRTLTSDADADPITGVS